MSVKQLVASWTSRDASPINAYIDLFAIIKDGGDVDAVMSQLPRPLFERIKDIAARHYSARTEGADPDEVALARGIMSWDDLPPSPRPVRKKVAAEVGLRGTSWVSPQVAVTVAALFKLAGDPSRLRILLILEEGDPDVGALSARMGEDRASLGYHLSILRHAGLVKSSRRGIKMRHELTEKGRKLLNGTRPLLRKPTGRLVPT
jgi:DNA-binding transcriptional ArsR family regulator